MALGFIAARALPAALAAGLLSGVLMALVGAGSTSWTNVAIAVLSAAVAAVAGAVLVGSADVANPTRRFLQVAANLHEGAVVLSPQREIVWVNSALCEFLGLDQSRVLGHSPADFLGDESRALLAEQLVRRDRGEFAGYEITVRRHDGEDRTIHVSPSPLISDSGEVEGTMAILSDVTSMRSTRLALEASEQRYRQLLESAHEGVAVIQRGRFAFVNQRLASMGGYDPEDLLHRDPIDLVHPVDRGRVEAHHAARILGEPGPEAHEFRAIASDGTMVWLRHTVVLIEWVGRPATLNLYSDVTAEHQNEEALARRERRSRSFYEDTPALLVATDAAGVIVGTSNLLLERLGKSRGEVIGRSLEEFFVDSRDGSFLDDLLGPELLRHGRATLKSCRLKARSGDAVPVRVNAVLDRDEGGQPRGMLAVLEDCSEIDEIARQLRRAQQLEALGTLAGGIAHDFNNILFAIQGYADMAAEEAPAGSRCRTDLEEIMRAAKRASSLVEQIVAFARQGQQDLQPMQPQPVLKESMRMLRSALPASILMRFAIDDGHRSVLASPAALRQLLTSLCSALARSIEGEGTIDVSLQPYDVEVRSESAGVEPGRYLQLRLTLRPASGHDLSPTVDETIAAALCNVSGLIDELGARRTQEIAPPGARVVALLLREVSERPLPVSTTPRSSRALPESLEEKRGRALVVDDEAPLVSMLVSMLGALGLDASGFTDARLALDTFLDDPQAYRVIVTDQTMPELTGYAFSQQILNVRPDMPIILCTGYTEAVTLEDVLALGVRAFLMKPFTLAQLGEAVDRALETPAPAVSGNR